MSNLEQSPTEAVGGGHAAVVTRPVRELLEGREVVLGGTRGMPVVRTLLVGEFGGARSPERAYTPIVGAEISLPAGGRTRLDLEPEFEYAALALTGTVEVGTVPLDAGDRAGGPRPGTRVTRCATESAGMLTGQGTFRSS